MDSPSVDQAQFRKKKNTHTIQRKTLENDGGVDLISNLPDDILSRIISKLPTKYTIGTSVLSTRWKHLFSSIPDPILDFDDSLFLHPPKPRSIGLTSYDEEPSASFIDFMYRVMDVILKDVPTVSRFRLKLEHEYEDHQILDWLCAALMRGVMSLELIFNLNYASELFETLSGCATLTSLELENSIIHAPPSFSLPNLKYLAIKHTLSTCEDSLPPLLNGCPKLEHLVMSYTTFGEIETLTISIPSLKFLVIEYCFNEQVPYKLVLDTPELDVLFYQNSVAKGYTVKNLSTLRKARIDFSESDHLWEGDFSQYAQNVADLVTGCCYVESLSISKPSLTLFYNAGRPLPLFRNLKHLQLGGFDTSGWELLPHMLDSAPNLELLNIVEAFFEEKGCYERFASSLPVNVPVCLSSHLQQIEIWAFKGAEDEFKLVEYFLKSAKVLLKIEISCCDMSWETYICIKERFFSLKSISISKTCNLSIWRNKYY